MYRFVNVKFAIDLEPAVHHLSDSKYYVRSFDHISPGISRCSRYREFSFRLCLALRSWNKNRGNWHMLTHNTQWGTRSTLWLYKA